MQKINNDNQDKQDKYNNYMFCNVIQAILAITVNFFIFSQINSTKFLHGIIDDYKSLENFAAERDQKAL